MRGKTIKQVSLHVIQRSDGRLAAPVVSESGFAYVFHAALSADGHRLIAVLAGKATPQITPVRAWDLHTNPPVSADLKHAGKEAQYVDFVALSPDGRHAATASGATPQYSTSAVWLWNLSSNQGKPLPVDANRNVLCVAFSPDGRRVLTVQDGLAQLWDTATGRAVGPAVISPRAPDRKASWVSWVVEGRQMPLCGTFAADGQAVLATVGDAAVYRLDAESGVPLPGGPIPARDAVQAVAFSGDGRRFIAQLADSTARVWDVRTGRAAGPPLTPAESKSAVALSTDGRLALTASQSAVHVWETETGLPLGPPLSVGATEQVRLCDRAHVMAFTRSGVILWDLTPGPTPAGDLVRLSGLFSGRRIDPAGAPVSFPADELGQAWSDFHGRQPELPEQPAESALDWHRRKARESESAGDRFAALVHLNPLIAAAPNDVDLRRRRAESEARLGRYAAAAADFAVAVQHQPADIEAKISLAVLSARLGHRDLYRAACTPLFTPLPRVFQVSPTAIAAVHAATLRPDGLDNPEALIKLLEHAARFFRSDSGLQSALAFAQYRAGHLEAALQSARRSLIAYSPLGIGSLPGQQAQAAPKAEDVTPERATGTPREWFLMALVEARLDHGDGSTAWRNKAVRWLDRAGPIPPIRRCWAC